MKADRVPAPTFWERAGLSKEEGDKIDQIIAGLRSAGIPVERMHFLALLPRKTAQELRDLSLKVEKTP